MDKRLAKNYALLGKQTTDGDGLTACLRSFFKNSTMQIILFAIIMSVVGALSQEKILPYSWLSAFASTFSYAIAAVGFCLLMGYSGLASLGTGGFIGIGTYSVHYIMSEAGLPFGIALITAIAVAVLIGVIVGFISLRIEGIYLVILTLGLSEILRNLYMVLEDRITISTNPNLFGIEITRQMSLYVVVVVLAVIMIITGNIINSPTGRAMLAMKNSTAAAQAMGISLMKYRLMAFIICTVYASISGTMLIIVVRGAMASQGTGFYALITSLNILAAVIIGGYKSIWGAVFGSFIMYGMQTVVLNNIKFLAENPVIITFVSGILVIIVVMFYPGGLAQLVLELRGKARKLRIKMKEARYGKDLG
ncbi:MAG: branched-chain amino acid ABC transporter permease [Clostridia bacterium]|nr:branched-chain amino acid ABC transporter permease [Clostridia bacterium]